MQIPLLVRGRGLHASSADRLTRFRQVLRSAQRTPCYGHSLATAGLHTRRAIQQLRSVEDTLPRIPLFEPEGRAHPPRIRCSPKAALVNPLPGAPEIAIYAYAGDTPKEILAGTFGTLSALAGKVTVRQALIVITGIEEGALTLPNRDTLWQGFGVPSFQQFLGLDGQLIAYECEAHDGLHIAERNAILEERPEDGLILTSLTDLAFPILRRKTGFFGRILRDDCACGRPGPRVLDLGQSAHALT